MAESYKPRWHQRFAPIRWLRGVLRKALYFFLGKTLGTDDGKAVVVAALDGLLPRPSGLSEADLRLTPAPYPGLGSHPKTFARTDTIIITARFRSGSTLLWNLFRNLDGFTSYYEPFNERRWFDPSARGNRMDATHRNVSDYWQEFDGLSVLGDYYREDWIRRKLLMDASAWDPGMKRYVELLIDRAPGRAALQFNRIDFRLPWFRRNFPGAKIVHLYRHPREQWCSSLMDVTCFPKDGTIRDFARHDKFYLLPWAEDLRYHFPFLDPASSDHPYQIFYYIWKLSFLCGRKYSHHSLAFEDLARDPDTQLRNLFAAVDVQVDSLDRLKALIVRPAADKSRQYADDAWFQRHEAICESVLADWLRGVDAAGREPTLDTWPVRPPAPHRNGVRAALESGLNDGR